MSCDEIKVIDETNEVTIVNHEDQVNVVTEETKIIIEDNVEVVKSEEEETEVIINAADVIISGSQDVDIDMNCTANEQVGDAVYIFAGLDVRQANNSNISTAKVVGFIVSKSRTTSCKVRIAGRIDVFVGMTIGSQYFLDNVDGEIGENAPTTTGSVLVRVGQAIDTDVFLIDINNNYIIRS